MSEREVTTKNGKAGFRLQRYAWRSKPTMSPLTGRAVRCVVGVDEQGGFRAATRIGCGEGQTFETKFAVESFGSKDQAIQASRGLTRDFLSHEAEVYANGVKDKRPGQEIVRVDMDDGWSTAINAAGSISPAKARVMKVFEGPGRKQPDKKYPLRGRSIDR